MSRGGRSAAQGQDGPHQNAGDHNTARQDDARPSVKTQPGELFPDIEIPKSRPITRLERAQVAHYLTVRKRIHEGPFFTVLDENARIGRTSSKRAAFNPFEDMPTYTKKYKPTVRKLPQFSTTKYDLKLFPEELWDVVDPSRITVNGSATKSKGQRQRPVTKAPGLDDDAEEDEDDVDEAIRTADEDEEVEEPNPEDDFDENDSDMGADYNAEAYFDAGDDDFDGGDGDAGDDGGID